MHRVFIILFISTFPLRAAADTLSDLRATLDRFPAKAPFAARATVRANAAAADDASRGGTSSFEIDSGPAGFSVRIPRTVLDAADLGFFDRQALRGEDVADLTRADTERDRAKAPCVLV